MHQLHSTYYIPLWKAILKRFKCKYFFVNRYLLRKFFPIITPTIYAFFAACKIESDIFSDQQLKTRYEMYTIKAALKSIHKMYLRGGNGCGKKFVVVIFEHKDVFISLLDTLVFRERKFLYKQQQIYSKKRKPK